MLVLDNIIFELQRAGGISVYWAELVARHQKTSGKVAFFGCPNANIFSANLALRLSREFYPSWMSRRYLPFEGGVQGRHIFHSSYFRYSNNVGAINVTTVHDFIYERYIRGLRASVHGFQKRLSVKKSAGIICVSEHTRNDLLEFYPWLDESCVRVIYNGVSDDFFRIDDPLPVMAAELNYVPVRPFFLFVGDRSSYKNFDVFLQLADVFLDFDLVVVGGQSFNEAERARLSGVSSRVRHFRGISSRALNLLYNSAFCLVYPSSYEGFGIPILEAMKAGCPVVSIRSSSIPEVAGESALLADGAHLELLAEKISQLFSVSLYESLRESGYRQADKFSWDKCFQETIDFYQDLWG